MKYLIVSIIFIIACTSLFAGNADVGIDILVNRFHESCTDNDYIYYDSSERIFCPSLSYYKMLNNIGIGTKVKVYMDRNFDFYYFAAYMCMILQGNRFRLVLGYGVTSFGNETESPLLETISEYTQLYHSITINPALKICTIRKKSLYLNSSWDRTYNPIEENSPLLHIDRGLADLFSSGLTGLSEEFRMGRLSVGLSLSAEL